MDINKVIRSLFAKAESTHSEHEAKAAILKAQELMAKYGIQSISDEDKIAYTNQSCIHSGNRSFRRVLANVIAPNFKVKYYLSNNSLGRERKSLETFLDVIQQTAMYFIETYDGIFEAKKSSYDVTEFFLISQKRAQRLLQMGDPVYLVFPEGELLTFDRKAIDQHDGLFATERAVWFTAECRAA